ncbi:MAG: hypothetical protein M0002_13685 [Rhodospirillales bacterium]|nr:hypothetical protein [Rhodospirillales bacterium]
MAEKSNLGEMVASGKIVAATHESVPEGVRVEAPAGVASVSVAGQNFTARDGAFRVPAHFGGALREHFAGLARHAEGVAARLARESVAAAKGDVREAMKLLQGEMDKLGI